MEINIKSDAQAKDRTRNFCSRDDALTARLAPLFLVMLLLILNCTIITFWYLAFHFFTKFTIIRECLCSLLQYWYIAFDKYFKTKQ